MAPPRQIDRVDNEHCSYGQPTNAIERGKVTVLSRARREYGHGVIGRIEYT